MSEGSLAPGRKAETEDCKMVAEEVEDRTELMEDCRPVEKAADRLVAGRPEQPERPVVANKMARMAANRKARCSRWMGERCKLPWAYGEANGTAWL